MRTFIAILCGIFVMISYGYAQEYRLPVKEIQKVASEGLVNFSKVITKQNNYREMGFESPDELGRMRIGEPSQMFVLPLDELKKYQKGRDIFDMLTGGNQVIYPVLVDDQIRSSIIVAEKDKIWRAVSFGNPSLIKLLDKTRNDCIAETKLPSSSYFIVEIPSLNLFFIAHRLGVDMMFTPILDDERYGFKAGKVMPADKVLTLLLPAAIEHDGLPR